MKNELNSDVARSSSLAAAATVRDAQQWSSVVTKHTLRLEHAAVDIGTDRVLYHLELELSEPLPSGLLAHAEYLCLSWHFGGIWKIRGLQNNNCTVQCESWRTTDMDHHQVNEIAKKVEESQQPASMASALTSKMSSTDDKDGEALPPCLFEWKMQLGSWGDNTNHWFLRDIRPPTTSGRVKPGEQQNLMSDEELENMPIVVQLLAGFAPVELQVEVNTIMAVDTVSQTFSADVTWQATMPALSAIREDSVIKELLDILEFDATQFEFTNINSTQEERDLTTSLTLAGEVEFVDPTLVVSGQKLQSPSLERVNHLIFSRRIIAVFSEEMSLYTFPFDQQKLTFDFSTGNGVRESMRITPCSVDAGSFAIDNYKLSNVFDIVYQDKVFVGQVETTGPKKAMTFEIMLERKSGYYLTNVAIPSACITYLCFISYAPLSDGSLMDTDARLQIVLTLLLTAVTFKNQVASLIPQVSYFTWLDKYVFFCFVVTCVVTMENSLFPLIEDWLSKNWSEEGLLGFSFGAFTLVNIAWAVYTIYIVARRTYASKVLLQVHEFSRVVSAEIPSGHRESVLREYLDEAGFPKWSLPVMQVSEIGDILVQLPDDSPYDTARKAQRALEQVEGRQAAEEKRDSFKRIFQRLNPGATLPTRSVSNRVIPVARLYAQDASEGRHARRRVSVASEFGAISGFENSTPAPRRVGAYRRFA